jgi:hypothetical protein
VFTWIFADMSFPVVMLGWCLFCFCLWLCWLFGIGCVSVFGVRWFGGGGWFCWYGLFVCFVKHLFVVFSRRFAFLVAIKGSDGSIVSASPNSLTTTN